MVFVYLCEIPKCDVYMCVCVCNNNNQRKRVHEFVRAEKEGRGRSMKERTLKVIFILIKTKKRHFLNFFYLFYV